ncbi:cytochrome P450 [Frankia sp. CNm7]|uniref:Cytochrome P450 n=1 Tax=Frankia nepalensis TaxID=1836974 RepID=A0A937UTP8_9ACTN|nr:cytochrome P450 [Frankia nepalensis]MBL7500944.1 cytochrome P450 [Frankia nepalensis]MBL7510081.1 cytochrome P450 [Frankia nepalensis]MBL7521742.1 cytochrome P450 [Frankia nepalensis]MBL7633313.1 cytochrome P450 [Frankia nepalensis]
MFDPTDAELRRDPYPTYRRMREESPVWRSAEGVYYLSRYEDCHALFRDPALSYDTLTTRAFQNSLSRDPDVRERQLTQARKSRTILELDPPDHARLRNLLTRAFSVRSVEASEPMIAGYVDQLLDDLDGPAIDLVSDFAVMLPILVICDLLAVPPEERHQFVAIGHAVTRSVDPDVPIDERNAANQRLRDYIATLVAIRRDHPGDDLMSRLIEAAEDGRLASEEELLSNTGLLLLAGFESTTNLITNAIYQLLRHPDQLALLTAEPAHIRTAIEEVLRFDPPVHMMRPRTITAAARVGGAEFREGDAVVPLLAAANRDPEEFADAETFDIRRRVNRHMGFGLGHHLCLGAALARMEARLAVSRIFNRFPNLSLSAAEEPEFRPHLTVRGFARLPVTL